MGDCISWCNPVFKRVTELPPVDHATRNHAYVTPDNIAYILNEEGDGFITLSSGSGGGKVKLSSGSDILQVTESVDNGVTTWTVDTTGLGDNLVTYLNNIFSSNFVPYEGQGGITVDNNSNIIRLDDDTRDKLSKLGVPIGDNENIIITDGVVRLAPAVIEDINNAKEDILELQRRRDNFLTNVGVNTDNGRVRLTYTMLNGTTKDVEFDGGATPIVYDDTPLRDRVTALENRPDRDTVFDNTDNNRRLTALENKEDKDTKYTGTDGVIVTGTQISLDREVVPSKEAVDALTGEVDKLKTRTDNDTTYTAGTGLSLSGTKFTNTGQVFKDIEDTGFTRPKLQVPFTDISTKSGFHVVTSATADLGYPVVGRATDNFAIINHIESTKWGSSLAYSVNEGTMYTRHLRNGVWGDWRPVDKDTKYTAGNGVVVNSNNVISIDTTKVADKETLTNLQREVQDMSQRLNTVTFNNVGLMYGDMLGGQPYPTIDTIMKHFTNTDGTDDSNRTLTITGLNGTTSTVDTFGIANKQILLPVTTETYANKGLLLSRNIIYNIRVNTDTKRFEVVGISGYVKYTPTVSGVTYRNTAGVDTPMNFPVVIPLYLGLGEQVVGTGLTKEQFTSAPLVTQTAINAEHDKVMTGTILHMIKIGGTSARIGKLTNNLTNFYDYIDAFIFTHKMDK